MAKKSKIYTKTGDDGTTGLFGGSRIKKNDIRLEAYGTLDELNSYIGLIRSFGLEQKIIQQLLFIQEKLFIIGARLASDERGKQITKSLGCTDDDIRKLEEAIDLYQSELPDLEHFIVPGGNQVVAFCHVARTVCRRAERRIIQLMPDPELPANIIRFINRLSDFLFILSRKLGKDSNLKETFWIPK